MTSPVRSRSVLLWIVAFPLLMGVDAVAMVAGTAQVYDDSLGQLAARSPNFWSGALLYAILALGLVRYVLVPGLGRRSVRHLCLEGALFTFIAFISWDLISFSLIEGFPLNVVLMDTVICPLVGGITTCLTLGLLRGFLPPGLVGPAHPEA